ncbi:MAG: IS607 family transposase [Deltaproteobacteria bacterium]|nr:IS607 family transposase [Deltaproteobacteria bacterium]
MSRLVSIGVAAKALGVSISTLRRWERTDRLHPILTKGGHRRYDIAEISPEKIHKERVSDRKTIAYARVSNNGKKRDLESQKRELESFCENNGWSYEIISDMGSGVNYQKQGLKRLINSIAQNESGRLVLTHKDCLIRLGAELIFSLCEAKNVEVVIINKGEWEKSDEDLAEDILEMITVFASRLYGFRNPKNKKLIDDIKDVALDSISKP